MACRRREGRTREKGQDIFLSRVVKMGFGERKSALDSLRPAHDRIERDEGRETRKEGSSSRARQEVDLPSFLLFLALPPSLCRIPNQTYPSSPHPPPTMSSPSPPSSTTPSTPNPSPPDDPQPSFSGSLQPLPSLPAPQPQHYSSASASRSSSTHRSRSPSSRNDLQTLLRTGGHLSLTASLSEQGSSTSGNPLRRPVDVIPAGTEGLAMPSMDSFLATKDAKAGLGIAGVGGERLGEEAAASTYHPRFAGSPSSNMRRTSSASSTATITQLSRTSSNPSFPPSSSSAASTTYPPASYTIGLGSGAPSLSSAGLSPGPRAHIRTQGVRQPPSSPRPPSSRPESPFKPLSTSLPTTGVSTSASTPPDSPNPTAPSTIFLPSQPSSRKPSVSAGILVRRDSFVGLEGSEEALSMVDSPVGTPGARRTSVEQELLEATRRLEISEATGAAAGEIEIQGASSAQAFNDSLSRESRVLPFLELEPN